MEGWRTYIYKRTSQVKKERKRKEEKQKGRKKRKTLMMKDNVSCLLLLLLLLNFFFSFYLIMLSFSFTVHSELNCWESFCAQNGYPPPMDASRRSLQRVGNCHLRHPQPIETVMKLIS